MEILRFIRKEAKLPQWSPFIIAAIAGIANSIILAIINVAAQSNYDSGEVSSQLFIVYLICIVLFFYSRSHALLKIGIMVEVAIDNIRSRLIDKVRHTELAFIEKKGVDDIYTLFHQDANSLSQSANIIVQVIQSSVILIVCMLYILILSPFGFFIIFAITLFSSAVYFFYSQQSSLQGQQEIYQRTEYYETLNHCLDGFKEIKINERKSLGLYADIKTIADQTHALKIETNKLFVFNIMFSRLTSNLTLGILVFVLPLLTMTPAPIVIKLLSFTLFIMGPLEVLISSGPLLSRVSAQIRHFYAFEAELDSVARRTSRLDENTPGFTPFKRIQLQAIEYHYESKNRRALFKLGPIDINLKQGELLYIVGGNGSGKSTLLKLLSSLYYPTKGQLRIDGKIINAHNYARYRDLFAIVLTDYHLFDRLYGLSHIDTQQVNDWLNKMELNHHTQFINDHFTPMNLSASHKKRLAYIVAILENKPIYIFDEIAADQDPSFKRFFYTHLLPEMKTNGKTVIVVTHDEMYFDTADRIIFLDNGKIIKGTQ